MANPSRVGLGLLLLLHGGGALVDQIGLQVHLRRAAGQRTSASEAGQLWTSASAPTLGRGRGRATALGRAPRRTAAVASALPALRGGGSLLGLAHAVSPAVLATSAAAVAELVISVGIGFAVVQSGLIDQSAIAALAKIVYNVFVPIFLFTSVLRTVTTYGLSAGMLALPLVGMAQIFIGLAVSSLALRIAGITLTSPKSRRLIICSSFGNSGVLPLLLVEALFRAPYPDASVMPRAASYISFYLLGWSPVFWSVGSSILTGGGEEGGSKWSQAARKIISPPIVGALSGLCAALLVPRALLQARPVACVLTCLSSFARAYPATALLVLAGSLAGGAPSRSRSTGGAAETAVVEAEAEAPPVGGRRELSTWASLVSIMASRYLLSPAIAWSLIIALRKAGFFPPVAVDPVLTFVVLLQAAMPPAQNSVIMLQVVGDKLGAKKLSRMLFMLYLLAVVPMSFLVSFFLQTASLCA